MSNFEITRRSSSGYYDLHHVLKRNILNVGKERITPSSVHDDSMSALDNLFSGWVLSGKIKDGIVQNTVLTLQTNGTIVSKNYTRSHK